MNGSLHKLTNAILILSFIIGISLVSMCPVSAETEKVTLINQGFESGIPENWENTGWVLNWYGSPHNGSNWISASTIESYIETPALSFGENTKLVFWYEAEHQNYPMSLSVKIDDTEIWNDTDFSHTEYQKAEINLSSYTADHSIRFTCQKSEMYVVNIDDILITSYKEKQDDTPTGDDDTNNGDGGGNSGGSPMPPAENIPPTANASKDVQYQGLTRESIKFDASNSVDPDGKITSYTWDFGDNSTKTGTIVYHSYSKPGTYQVKLTITDDDDASDSDSYMITITEGNNPPEIPEIKATEEPISSNVTYMFHIRSADPDNHTVSFRVNWDDGTQTTTDFYQSNTIANISHAWEDPGVYTIQVTAEDSQGKESESREQIIFIDVYHEYIDDEITGYLLDYSQSSGFSHFLNIKTNQEIPLEKIDGHTYLIDSDNDNQFEYQYNEKSGIIRYDNNSDDGTDNTPGSSADTPGVGVFIVFAVIVFFVCIRKIWK